MDRIKQPIKSSPFVQNKMIVEFIPSFPDKNCLQVCYLVIAHDVLFLEL